ncbi:MAG: hypothetical protein JWR37_5024 [Mycobacterium sp.]|nr:hypothetical protein [Mycobacterium sp.]
MAARLRQTMGSGRKWCERCGRRSGPGECRPECSARLRRTASTTNAPFAQRRRGRSPVPDLVIAEVARCAGAALLGSALKAQGSIVSLHRFDGDGDSGASPNARRRRSRSGADRGPGSVAALARGPAATRADHSSAAVHRRLHTDPERRAARRAAVDRGPGRPRAVRRRRGSPRDRGDRPTKAAAAQPQSAALAICGRQRPYGYVPTTATRAEAEPRNRASSVSNLVEY